MNEHDMENLRTVLLQVLEERSSIDSQAHRTHHEYISRLIDKDKKRSDMYDAVKLHVVKMGGWSFITIIGFLVWYWLTHR